MPRSREATINRVVQCFRAAASGREWSQQKPWEYGWSQPSYRRSASASLPHNSDRAVSLDSAAVAAFEEGTEALLRLPAVIDRYDVDEFWALMASLVGRLPMTVPPEHIERQIESVLTAPESLVVMPLANVEPFQGSFVIGPLTIGQFRSLEERIRDKVRSAEPGQTATAMWWMSADDAGAPAPVTLAYRTEAQRGRAVREAEDAFDDAIAIAAALEPDLDALALYSLRGDTNRPGVRGLTIDRPTLADLGRSSPRIRRELSSDALICDGGGNSLHHRWFAESPFPVERLMREHVRRQIVERILSGGTVLHRRLRLAARWHAKAHWALDVDDAVLALGIALESMLSEKGPSPGRVLAERYALLVQDPMARRARYREFQGEFYPARSSVAHGAKRTSIGVDFVRRLAREVRSTFAMVAEVTHARRIDTEEDYDEFFASLKWDGRTG